MTYHAFNSLAPHTPDRSFHGRSKVHLLLDEHCFTDVPEDIFTSPAALFAAIRDHFEGEWFSEASVMNAKVEHIVSQRFDCAHDWWQHDRDSVPERGAAQATGCWTSALHQAANANLFDKIETDRLCDPAFIAEIRATWQRNMMTAAVDFPSPRVAWTDVVTPAIMLEALDSGAAPGFAFADALFADFAQVSFDWREKLDWERGTTSPSHDGHWIIVTLRILPPQTMSDVFYCGPGSFCDPEKTPLYKPWSDVVSTPARCAVGILGGRDYAREHLVPLDVAQPGDLVAMVVHHKADFYDEETQSLEFESFFAKGATAIEPVSHDQLTGRNRFHAAHVAKEGITPTDAPHYMTLSYDIVECPISYELAIIVFADAILYVNVDWLNNCDYGLPSEKGYPVVIRMWPTMDHQEGPVRLEQAHRFIKALDQIFPPMGGARQIELPPSAEFVSGSPETFSSATG